MFSTPLVYQPTLFRKNASQTGDPNPLLHRLPRGTKVEGGFAKKRGARAGLGNKAVKHSLYFYMCYEDYSHSFRYRHAVRRKLGPKKLSFVLPKLLSFDPSDPKRCFTKN